MKNLLHEHTKNEVLARIDKLTPQAKREWGKMNVHQAMRHMAMAFDIAHGTVDPTVAQAPPMPKWLLRFFLLNMPPPKGKAQTFKEMDMVSNQVNPVEFENERKNLRNAVDRFYTATELAAENKMAGKFSRDDWGKLNYNHTDHHLRQFGV